MTKQIPSKDKHSRVPGQIGRWRYENAAAKAGRLIAEARDLQAAAQVAGLRARGAKLEADERRRQQTRSRELGDKLEQARLRQAAARKGGV